MTTGGEALAWRIGRAAAPISRRITGSRSLGVLALIVTPRWRCPFKAMVIAAWYVNSPPAGIG